MANYLFFNLTACAVTLSRDCTISELAHVLQLAVSLLHQHRYLHCQCWINIVMSIAHLLVANSPLRASIQSNTDILVGLLRVSQRKGSLRESFYALTVLGLFDVINLITTKGDIWTHLKVCFSFQHHPTAEQACKLMIHMLRTDNDVVLNNVIAGINDNAVLEILIAELKLVDEDTSFETLATEAIMLCLLRADKFVWHVTVESGFLDYLVVFLVPNKVTIELTKLALDCLNQLFDTSQNVEDCNLIDNAVEMASWSTTVDDSMSGWTLIAAWAHDKNEMLRNSANVALRKRGIYVPPEYL
jgi:hypothetical protein